MADITPYESPLTLEIAIENGNLTVVDFTGAAARTDAKFLMLWLHGKSEETVKAYTAEITKFYAVVCKSLKDTTLEDLQAFSDSLLHLKPTSRARALAAVKSALSFGVKTGYLQVNVGAAVKL